jgi:methyl-accepting chemotaxis protein
MTSLEALQKAVSRALTAFGIALVPVLALIAAALQRSPVQTAAVAAILAGAPLAAILLKRPTVAVGYALVVTLVGQISLLVFIFDGHPWQIEMHFYYFVILALLAGFCHWGILIAAATLTAAHHLTLNAFLPEAIFSGGTDFLRVVIHAVAVVLETAMLIGIAHHIRLTIARAQGAHEQAEMAAAELERTASQRDRDLAATTTRANQMSEMLERFKHEMKNSTDILHLAAQTLKADAGGLDSSAARANTESTAAASGANEAAREVQAAAAAGGQLAASIGEVGANAARSSQLAACAVSEAEKTTETIDKLVSATDEIGKVSELISAIAAQTNLLALNATIEAARAGESGRGFAVVAQEVKALAGETANATKEISRRIAAMQQETNHSVEAIRSISGTIRQLDDFSARIAQAVEEQAATAREIAANVNAAANGVGQIGGAIVQFDNVATQASRSANKLNEAAAKVADQTDRIREQVRMLTEEIRAIPA